MSLIRKGEHPNFEDLWVPWSELRVWARPQSAPGGAAAQPKTPVRLTPPDDSLKYHITHPSVGDAPCIREFDANLVAGKVLQATANFNYSPDPESCLGGQAFEMYPGLDLPVLSVKTGDLIKFIRLTDFHNIAYGELLCQGDESRAAEMAQHPMSGCFSTLRCTFAEGQAPDPKPSAPGGAADPLGLFHQRPKLVTAKREPEQLPKRTKLSDRECVGINQADEPMIKELIQQGIPA